MTEQDADGAEFDPTSVDFDAIYRGEAPFAGTNARFEVVPWDIGEAQPPLVALERVGGFRGQVLDAGCGAGENALFLAERGHSVTAFDGASTAIEQAKQRARERGIDVEWFVADATKLTGVTQRFDTVLDSALYHCLTDEQRFDYSAALHRVSNPGAMLHLFCFAEGGPNETVPGPAPVSKDNLYRCLSRHWDITTIEPTTYATAFTRDILRRMVARMGDVTEATEVNPDTMSVDERGRIVGSMWQLRAERI